MSGVQRYCIHHGDWVDQDQAQLVEPPGSGPSLPVYACKPCVLTRSETPTPPGDAA